MSFFRISPCSTREFHKGIAWLPLFAIDTLLAKCITPTGPSITSLGIQLKFAIAEHTVGINAIVSRAVAILCSDRIIGPWLSNTCSQRQLLLKQLKDLAMHVDDTLTIDARKFSVAMLKLASFGDVMTRFNGSNHSGEFGFATVNNTSATLQIKKSQFHIQVFPHVKDQIIAAFNNIAEESAMLWHQTLMHFLMLTDSNH